MASVKVLNGQGQEVGTVDLPAAVFEAKARPSLVHQAVIYELAAMRQGTHKTKTRAEIRGGGRKPWRQTSTGRARQGSTRAPHWRHGGVVHGPVPRDHSVKLNHKMFVGALCSALSSRVENGLTVLDALRVDSGKIRDMVALLSAVNAGEKILVITHEVDEKTFLSLRNLQSIIDVTHPYDLSVYDILRAKTVLVTREAVDAIGEVYS